MICNAKPTTIDYDKALNEQMIIKNIAYYIETVTLCV